MYTVSPLARATSPFLPTYIYKKKVFLRSLRGEAVYTVSPLARATFYFKRVPPLTPTSPSLSLSVSLTSFLDLG